MGGKMRCPVCEAVLKESKEPGIIEPKIERWECPSPNCATIVTRSAPPLAKPDEGSESSTREQR